MRNPLRPASPRLVSLLASALLHLGFFAASIGVYAWQRLHSEVNIEPVRITVITDQAIGLAEEPPKARNTQVRKAPISSQKSPAPPPAEKINNTVKAAPQLPPEPSLDTQQASETTQESEFSSQPKHQQEQSAEITSLATPHLVGQGAFQSYENALLQRIERHKFYPRSALKRRIEGEVVLEVIIDHQGYVERSQLAQSSGHNILDRSALQTIERANPFPEFPNYIHQKKLSYLVPISYRVHY